MTGVTYPIDKYFNRYDPAKNFDKHLVRAGLGTQSAEINEIQENLIEHIGGIADSLFKEGDILRDCQILVNPTTGLTTLESGAIYLRKRRRGIAPASFTIPVSGTVNVGIRLVSAVITELEDPELRDPAVGTRNHDEPGAGRLRVTAAWGWDGDGGAGEFFGIYVVENGNVLAKSAPPVLDAVTSAIARYDRDSAGGQYIVSGLDVSATYNMGLGKFSVMITEGSARVNGFPIDVRQGIRFTYDADADTKAIISEPKTYTPSSGSMRVNLAHAPLITIDEVRCTIERTDTLTHGAFSGAKDALPFNSVLSLVEVKQGGTTYVAGTDYILTADQVDWTPGGAEPAPGSTYTVKYQYLSSVAATITAIDQTGFTISGPVPGSLFTIDYTFALPRFDAMVLDTDGRVLRIKGVASQYSPTAPSIAPNQLKLASLYHTWQADPLVIRDAIVVLPMNDLQAMRKGIYDLYDLVAQERLKTAIILSDPAAKRGVFVDPLLNDNMRDQGLSQTAAINNGEITLPISATISNIGTGITAPELLPYTLETIIDQPLKTGSMLVNPYQAFDPMPATVKLIPAFDFWTETDVTWASPITERITQRFTAIGSVPSVYVPVITATLPGQTSIQSSVISVRPSEFLRSRSVDFTIAGFDPGETLLTLTIDGIAVTPEAP